MVENGVSSPALEECSTHACSKEKEEPSWKWSVFEVLVHFLQVNTT